MTLWLNGRLVEGDKALSVKERGFLIGDGAFETVLMLDGAPIFLDAHIERLVAGLSTLRIACPAPLASIRATLVELAVRNTCASGAAAARITVSRGEGGRGLDVDAAFSPTLLASVEPYAPPTRAAVVTLTDRRVFSARSTRHYKSIGGYTEHILARLDAQGAGAEEGLLCNENGVVVGAAAASVFALQAGNVLRTPALDEGALNGVVRRIVLEEAHAMGLPVVEGGLAPSDLRSALLFLTNSLIGLRSAALPGGVAAAPPAFEALKMRYRRRVESQREAGKA